MVDKADTRNMALFCDFGQLLEEAQARKLITLVADEKSGGYIIKSTD